MHSQEDTSQSDEKTLETQRSGKTLEKRYLKKKARIIRNSLGDMLVGMISAGVELREVNTWIAHGKWEQWLNNDVGISRVTAHRYMVIADFVVDNLGPNWKEHELLTSQKALYRLSGDDVPEGVKENALAIMDRGEFLSSTIVDGLIKGALAGVEKEVNTQKILRHVSPRVQKLAKQYDLDVDVIAALATTEVNEPRLFEEIELTGCVSYDNTPIPLSDAVGRDIEDYVSETRFETRMAKNGIVPNHVISGGLVDALVLDSVNAPHEFSHIHSPTLAAVYFSSQNDVEDVLRSVELNGGKALMLVVSVQDKGAKLFYGNDAPEWIGDMVNRIISGG